MVTTTDRVSELLFIWHHDPDLLTPEEWNELKRHLDAGLSDCHQAESLLYSEFVRAERQLHERQRAEDSCSELEQLLSDNVHPRAYTQPHRSSPTVDLAAGHLGEIGERSPSRVQFAEFEVAGKVYILREDSDTQQVYLVGDIGADASCVWFGSENFQLSRASAGCEREIIGAGSADLDEFISARNQNRAAHPIRFGRD